MASPAAHRTHFKLLSEHYVESLSRSVQAGEIRRYDRDELETLAYMFMAARSYLYLLHVKAKGGSGALPKKVVETYMKLIRNGLT